MSKAKKFISMLLAVVMVLSAAPVSLFAYAADETFTPGSISFNKPEFTVDTSATTEVIRVAAKESSFATGNLIVAATDSGIPQADSGYYIDVAYAGETPYRPQVVFKITGATPSEVKITASLATITVNVSDPVVSGNTTTYTGEIATGSTATAGTDVVFTITYKVGGATYTAYAFSHVENILVMTGFITHRREIYNSIGTTSKKDTYMGAIVQVASKNMYSGMSDSSSVSNRAKGYINYAAQGNSSNNYLWENGKVNSAEYNTLTGTGPFDDFGSSDYSYAKAANSSSGEVGVLIKSNEKSRDNRANMCTADDSNRGEATVYIDKRNEVFGADANGKDGLNLRVSMQVIEQYRFSYAYVAAIGLYDGYKTFGDEDGVPSNTISAPLSVSVNTSHVTVGSLNGSYYYNWSYSYFSGDPSSMATSTSSKPWTEYSMIVDVQAKNDSGSISNTTQSAGGINLNIGVYDTRDLYNLYHGIMTGQSMTCVTDTYSYMGTINFTNGVNPQSSMYASGWSTFEAALKKAGSVIAKPDTNQTEIDTVTADLYTAYFSLGGYNANVNYQIKYNLADANGQDSGVAVPGSVIQTGTKAAGTTLTVAPATITGYTVTDTALKTKYLGGTNATETVTFLYTPNKYQLVAYSNGDAGTKFYEQSYGDTIDVSTLDYGTKEFYKFDGWYDTNGTSTGNWGNKLSTFTMPMANKYIYGKWSPAPLTVSAIPVVDGQELVGSDGNVIVKELGTVTPDADSTKTVQFARPADLDIEGYLFVEYYETLENGVLSNPVSWPLSFKLGDSGKTVYARMVDVDGKIVYESNGGTDVPDSEFTPPASVSAPTAPTKEGYTFEQWYYDRELTQPITWPVSMSSKTGFVAYAGWTANDVEITFNLGTVSTKYDTTEIAPIRGKADQKIEEYDYPVTPLKFGYVFDGWELDGERYAFDGTNTMPTTSVELKAIWRATEYSAFIELNSYEKLSGSVVETSTASAGDVVTIRMSTLTNFYTGSSVFVFMYDKDFFELVDTGSSAFTLNPDSEYISGIDAKKQGVTNSSSLPWPEGLDSTKYAAMMVAIDPKVTASNYNCEPMSDGEWIVEFQLRVKEGASGEGKVYMDNAWTRSPDNIMGTMFYGWGETKKTSVADTTNNVVVPVLNDASVVITVDEVTPPDTTLTLKANGGEWADGSVQKSYTGRTETEILDYVAPAREGYTLAGWVKEGDETVTWAEGYYAKEADNGIVYVAQWTANEYDVNFYTETVDGELYNTVKVGYELPITAPDAPSKVGYSFAGWVDADGNAADFAAGVNCPLGGADYFATWTPATDTEYKIVAKYYNQVTAAYATLSSTKTGTTGYTVQIVESVPATPAADTIYITVAELPVVQNGNYIYDAANNTLPITGVIAPDGSTTIEVNYVGKQVTFTYDANGGAFADGETVKTETKTFQSYAEGPGSDPVREGYTFTGWNPNFVLGTTRINQNRTFTAKWEATKYPVTFYTVNGDLAGTFSDGTTEQTVEFTYGSAITAPATPVLEGYTFKGWATSVGGAVTELGTLDSTEGKSFYAVYEPTQYSIDYYIDGEYQYSDTAIKGQSVTLREASAKTGYTFSGWKIDGEGDAVTQVTMQTWNITLEGTYTANNYDVIFNAAGGYFDGDTSATTKAVSTAFDGNITKPVADPVRTGYEFLGWTDTEGSTALITNFGTLTTTETVTYYAVWKATYASYTINVYYQDVTGVYPAEADESTTSTGLVEATVSVTPEEKTGFTIDTANSVTSGTVLADGSLALTVKYIRNKYTLSTDVDGVITEIGEYYYQSTITEPEKPTKTGYTCTGWSNLPADMKILADTVIVAQWQANPYTVTFYSDSTMQGEPLYTATLAYQTEYPVPTATKVGHTFKKWVDAATGNEVELAATETIPAGDATYYATWTVNEYTLTYRTYNGVYKQFQVPFGTAAADVPVPDEDPTREGYRFTGWSAFPEDAMPDEEVVITSGWAKEKYTLSFNTDGGSAIEDIPVTFGEDIEIPANPTKTGYSFTGWDNEIPETIPDLGENGAVITYTAQWTINKYNITWEITGVGVYQTDNDIEYGTVITAPTPTKQGYVFSGWSGYTEGMTMPDNALTFTGTWSAATDTAYTVYIHTMGVDGQYATETQNLTGTTEATVSAVYTVADGFELGANSVTSGVVAADGSLVLDVYLNRKTVTITFDSNGGSAVAPITQLYGTSVEAPAAPSLAGFTFGGWTPGVPETMPSADVTLVAQWTINKYDITWTIDGDEYHTDKDVEYGAAITAPTPTKQGYVFSGWSGYTEGMTMPDNALTFTGTWSAATDTAYTVYIHTMGVDGQYATETQNLTGTTNTTATAVYEIADGFVLGANSVTSGEIAADGSLVLNVYIDRREVTLTFDSNGGSDVADITQLYGTAVTAPAAPTREGYDFGGWDVTVPTTMPAEGMVITAQWNIKSYVVTFVDAEDEVFSQSTLEYMSAISAPAGEPEKVHYTFKGWSLTKIEGILVEEDLADIALIDFENAAPTVPAGDVTIYPVFVRVPVVLTLATDSTAVVDTTAATEDVNGYIYGLKTKLKESELLDKYLSVEGDGELIVTLTQYGVCGTGTKIEVYDNVENAVVETYYIIIFGDINGDASVSAADSSMIDDEILNVTSWSVEGSSDYDYCKLMAADVAGTTSDGVTLGDGVINSADEMMIVDTTLFISQINQVSGKAELL